MLHVRRVERGSVVELDAAPEVAAPGPVPAYGEAPCCQHGLELRAVRESHQLLVDEIRHRERAVVVVAGRVDVRDRVSRTGHQNAALVRTAKGGLPGSSAERDNGERDERSQRAHAPAHPSSFHVLPFLLPACGQERSKPEKYDATDCKKSGSADPGGTRRLGITQTPQPKSLRDRVARGMAGVALPRSSERGVRGI